jgi:hypothetical protein
VAGPVLYDLGDLIDGYAVDPVLRNDLGIVAIATLDRSGPTRNEAVPIALDFTHTRSATPTSTAGSAPASAGLAPSWASWSPTRATGW